MMKTSTPFQLLCIGREKMLKPTLTWEQGQLHHL